MKDYILNLDKPRTLRYGFKSMRVIRNKFGERSLDQLMNIKIDEIPFLAHAGLTHEDKNLTVEKLEDLLDEAIPEKYTILKITEVILDALASQMGVDTKKLGTAPKAEASAPAPIVETEKKKPKKKTLSTKKQKK